MKDYKMLLQETDGCEIREDNIIPNNIANSNHILIPNNHTVSNIDVIVDYDDTNSNGDYEIDLLSIWDDPKKKIREGRTSRKILVRRLPPDMTEAEFLEMVSPLAKHNYFNFVPANESNKFSRAYINFINTEDIVEFTEQFDENILVDSKGEEYETIVEFAPFQRIPKHRINRKKDPLCGTLCDDPQYLAFIEAYTAVEDDENNPQINENFYDLSASSGSDEEIVTPLIEYVREKKTDFKKQKDYRKEERFKKDLERKRIKDEIKRYRRGTKDVIKEKTNSSPNHGMVNNYGGKMKDKKPLNTRIKSGKNYSEEKFKALVRKLKDENNKTCGKRATKTSNEQDNINYIMDTKVNVRKENDICENENDDDYEDVQEEDIVSDVCVSSYENEENTDALKIVINKQTNSMFNYVNIRHGMSQVPTKSKSHKIRYIIRTYRYKDKFINLYFKSPTLPKNRRQLIKNKFATIDRESVSTSEEESEISDSTLEESEDSDSTLEQNDVSKNNEETSISENVNFRIDNEIVKDEDKIKTLEDEDKIKTIEDEVMYKINVDINSDISVNLKSSDESDEDDLYDILNVFFNIQENSINDDKNASHETNTTNLSESLKKNELDFNNHIKNISDNIIENIITYVINRNKYSNIEGDQRINNQLETDSSNKRNVELNIEKSTEFKEEESSDEEFQRMSDNSIEYATEKAVQSDTETLTHSDDEKPMQSDDAKSIQSDNENSKESDGEFESTKVDTDCNAIKYNTENECNDRVERRIKNKDRPSIAIYRPGMGKYSKYTLERKNTENNTETE